MIFNQKVSMQGRYKLTSRDLDTQEVIASSGWSDNKIIKSVESAKIMHETGFTSTPPFQVGRTDSGNYDSFENVIELTHTSQVLKPMTFEWVTANTVSGGFRIIGGGNYKFTPNTTVRGLKVNQVGIKGFSIAPVRNSAGALFSYPITPNAEIEVEFTLTIIIKPDPVPSIPTVDESGTQLFVTSSKVNVAVDDAQLQASNYVWTQLLSLPNSGLRLYPTVSGSVTDFNVISKMPDSPNAWQGFVGKASTTQPGDYNRKGYISSGLNSISCVRLGIPVGIPGIYTSVIFSSVYLFPVRTLTDISINSTFTERS